LVILALVAEKLIELSNTFTIINYHGQVESYCLLPVAGNKWYKVEVIRYGVKEGARHRAHGSGFKRI
jgi:hypothetical protein